MQIKLSKVVSTFAILLAGTPAFAADLMQAPALSPKPLTPSSAPDDPSGFYIRGTLGGSLLNSGGTTILGAGLPLGDPVNGYTRAEVPRDGRSKALIGGIGGGYRFNENLRGDLTLDYRQTRPFNARFSGTVPPDTVNGRINTRANAILGLANGYFDFTTFCTGHDACLTPYVGAGLGFARLRQARYSEVQMAQTGAMVADTAADVTRTNFAWGLMAGVAYTVSQPLTVDLGYRFASLGNGPQFKPVVGALAANQTVSFDKLQQHDIRLTLRYAFK